MKAYQLLKKAMDAQFTGWNKRALPCTGLKPTVTYVCSVSLQGVWDWTGGLSNSEAALLWEVLQQDQAEQRGGRDHRQDHGQRTNKGTDKGPDGYGLPHWDYFDCVSFANLSLTNTRFLRSKPISILLYDVIVDGINSHFGKYNLKLVIHNSDQDTVPYKLNKQNANAVSEPPQTDCMCGISLLQCLVTYQPTCFYFCLFPVFVSIFWL